MRLLGSTLRAAAACMAMVPLTAMAASETVTHKFKFDGKGARPFAALLQVGKRFFGTAGSGGDSDNGIVFSIAPSGGYRIVYSFKGGSLGSLPTSRLIEVGGVLYGTTLDGGGTACNAGCGTVFAITPQGDFRSLYAFQGGTDGGSPLAGLVALGGVLYGTTSQGGGSGCGGAGCGTVFSITPDGAEHTVYAFQGGTDGSLPNELIGAGTTLYATTTEGGGPNCTNSRCGTVVSVTTAGVETVLHSFITAENGVGPEGRLLLLNGILYGTTTYGGIVGPAQGSLGYGTAFQVTTGGVFTKLHDFTGTDGRFLVGGLISVGDLLYGTAQGGGANDNGVVYSLTLQGQESVIYSFGVKPDAAAANDIIESGGVFYGTSSFGGCKSLRYCGYGAGTVFSVTP